MRRRLLLMALAGAASLGAVVTPVIAQQSKPNILVIMSD